MPHGIELRNGKATWYRNRYVRTSQYANPGADRLGLALDRETGAPKRVWFSHMWRTSRTPPQFFPPPRPRQLSQWTTPMAREAGDFP